MPTSSHLLRAALPLVQTHGFTRAALSRSVLSLKSEDGSTTHTEPLSDTAVTALFGEGDNARRALIWAWLDEGVRQMGNVVPQVDNVTKSKPSGVNNRRPSIHQLLHTRLRYNEPVLKHLPEAFAVLAVSPSGIPPIDPLPAIKHASKIADEACYLSGDSSTELAWYARRASLATAYITAELHQLVSPATAPAFLDSLLQTSSDLRSSLGDVGQFVEYMAKSWRGIIKSSGIII